MNTSIFNKSLSVTFLEIEFIIIILYNDKVG